MALLALAWLIFYFHRFSQIFTSFTDCKGSTIEHYGIFGFSLINLLDILFHITITMLWAYY